MWIAVIYNTVERKETGFASELVAENEILGTARGIVEALGGAHEAVMLPVSPGLLCRIGSSPFEVAFNLAEGLGDRSGSEHLIPALLEAAELPYTGADSTALALCRDKARTKRLLAASGLATPAWQLFERPDQERAADLAFPLIVKPCLEDASIGITADSVVRDDEALRRRVAHVLEHYRQPALVEQFIEGREINCALLGNGDALEALPPAEILFRHKGDHPSIVTFESKWSPGSEVDRAQRPVCPADLPPAGRPPDRRGGPRGLCRHRLPGLRADRLPRPRRRRRPADHRREPQPRHRRGGRPCPQRPRGRASATPS